VPEGVVLALPGRTFPLDFAGGELTVHGFPLFISEQPNTGLGTGLNVWDGAVVLAKYLEITHPDLTGRRVLELGAGTGLVGIAAALLGADTLLTDLPYALPNLAAAVERNRPKLKGSAVVAELDWFKPTACAAATAAAAQGADFILGADVVWVEELIHPLLDTLVWATDKPTASGGKPVILLAHQTRSRASDAILFAGLAGRGFAVNTVPRALHHARYSDQAIDILEVTRL
jgi:SAM-dependent methyltransferase